MTTPAQRRRVKAWFADIAKSIPDGFTPLEAAFSVKCLDNDGDVCLINSKSDALNTWEAIGMLVSAQDDMRARLQCPIDEDEDT